MAKKNGYKKQLPQLKREVQKEFVLDLNLVGLVVDQALKDILLLKHLKVWLGLEHELGFFKKSKR